MAPPTWDPPKWDPPDPHVHILPNWQISIWKISFWITVFAPVTPTSKNFLFFLLDLTRPCLDWQLSAFLTSQPIYNPFKFNRKWEPKCKITLNVNLPKNRQAEKNLKCILRCSNVFSTNHQLTLSTYLSYGNKLICLRYIWHGCLLLKISRRLLQVVW